MRQPRHEEGRELKRYNALLLVRLVDLFQAVKNQLDASGH
jgi:hypothetical protein